MINATQQSPLALIIWGGPRK